MFGCNLQVGKGKRKKKENGKRKDRKCFSHACLVPRREGEKKRKDKNGIFRTFFFFFLIANKREIKGKMFTFF